MGGDLNFHQLASLVTDGKKLFDAGSGEFCVNWSPVNQWIHTGERQQQVSGEAGTVKKNIK